MADLRDTILRDYQVVDGPDDLTYRRRTAESDTEGTAISGVIRDEGLADKSADRDGRFLRQGETYWLLPKVVMDDLGFTPNLRDVLEEADGTRWLIEEVDARAGHTEFRCRCRRELTATG